MSRINNYEELLAEKKRLQDNLHGQKAFFNARINDIRDTLEPIRRVYSFFGEVKNNPAGSLLKLGSHIGIDILARQKFSKVGWLTKLFLPLALKFTASKTIDKVGQKIAS